MYHPAFLFDDIVGFLSEKLKINEMLASGVVILLLSSPLVLHVIYRANSESQKKLRIVDEAVSFCERTGGSVVDVSLGDKFFGPMAIHCRKRERIFDITNPAGLESTTYSEAKSNLLVLQTLEATKSPH